MLEVQGLFSAVPDPRAANARHRLDEVLLVALAATLCGAQTSVDIATFARAKLPLLRRFVRLAHGAPSHDTFSRLFQTLDPLAFEAAFRAFMAAFAECLSGYILNDVRCLCFLSACLPVCLSGGSRCGHPRTAPATTGAGFVIPVT